MYYYEQKLFSSAEDDVNQTEMERGDDNQMSEEDNMTGKVEAETVLPGEDRMLSAGCSDVEEPSNKPANRRDFYKKDSMEQYIYDTGEREHVYDACSLV